jgi:hypothetical protein
MSAKQVWQPRAFLRFDESIKSSMRTARILTDAGSAFLKVLGNRGNRDGPHHLAC